MSSRRKTHHYCDGWLNLASKLSTITDYLFRECFATLFEVIIRQLMHWQRFLGRPIARPSRWPGPQSLLLEEGLLVSSCLLISRLIVCAFSVEFKVILTFTSLTSSFMLISSFTCTMIAKLQLTNTCKNPNLSPYVTQMFDQIDGARAACNKLNSFSWRRRSRL